MKEYLLYVVSVVSYRRRANTLAAEYGMAVGSYCDSFRSALWVIIVKSVEITGILR